MSEREDAADVQELDVTVWVGKRGIEAVTDELEEQLDNEAAVKVKFLRSSRARADTESLAEELAAAVGGTVAGVRGHTAVIRT